MRIHVRGHVIGAYRRDIDTACPSDEGLKERQNMTIRTVTDAHIRMHIVTIIPATTDDAPITTEIVGSWPTYAAAACVAKRAAGPGARFFRRGVFVGYAGTLGTVWIAA